MANAKYPKWREAMISGAANSTLNNTVRAVLVDSAGYTYNATHAFLSDVPVSARVGTPVTLANKTFVNGVFDADDAVINSVPAGTHEFVIVYIDTGTESTSRLVAFIDTGTGLPVTLSSSGSVTIEWDNGANKILAV